MKEPVLVLIKPDAIAKDLTGQVLTRLAEANLMLLAAKEVNVSRRLAEDHYRHLKNKPFFDETVLFLMGRFHNRANVLALVYYGENAVRKCRTLAGATNPEEAALQSIRGQMGRITTRGVFENVVHVSSNRVEARREITLWFDPGDIVGDIYPTKIQTVKSAKKKVWK